MIVLDFDGVNENLTLDNDFCNLLSSAPTDWGESSPVSDRGTTMCGRCDIPNGVQRIVGIRFRNRRGLFRGLFEGTFGRRRGSVTLGSAK